MNKRILLVFSIMGLLLLPLAVQGQGHHGGGNGNGGGGNFNILEGTPFTFSGSVISAEYAGSGITVSTASGNITVSGLGPNRYWDNLGLLKPVVGDAVSGNGYTVDYNGALRNVLVDISVNGTLVQLRDQDGRRLWRGGRGKGHNPGFNNGDYRRILEGTPFNYDGEVISTNAEGEGSRKQGLTIATVSGNVELHGIGPFRFWHRMEPERPAAGDKIKAIGFAVDFDGTIINVLMSLVLEDGTTVQLRDPDTGAPMWRRHRRKNQ